MRTPCCEKMGLKKGPWTPEEDRILISYIHQHGHHNWRALPKQAGLLRCGKSCRLRWINYLRPDIKRGNFTEEEEQTIIELHQMLGNRWSAIAARLPGRTDNEIKNFWNTHLKKKKLHQKTDNNPSLATSTETTSNYEKCYYSNIPTMDTHEDGKTQSSKHMVQPQVFEVSHAQQPSSISSSAQMKALSVKEEDDVKNSNVSVSRSFMVTSTSNSTTNVDGNILLPKKSPALLDTTTTSTLLMDSFMNNNNKMNEDLDFWYSLFVKTGEYHQGLLHGDEFIHQNVRL